MDDSSNNIDDKETTVTLWASIYGDPGTYALALIDLSASLDHSHSLDLSLTLSGEIVDEDKIGIDHFPLDTPEKSLLPESTCHDKHITETCAESATLSNGSSDTSDLTI